MVRVRDWRVGVGVGVGVGEGVTVGVFSSTSLWLELGLLLLPQAERISASVSGAIESIFFIGYSLYLLVLKSQYSFIVLAIFGVG